MLITRKDEQEESGSDTSSVPIGKETIRFVPEVYCVYFVCLMCISLCSVFLLFFCVEGIYGVAGATVDSKSRHFLLWKGRSTAKCVCAGVLRLQLPEFCRN